MTEPITLEFTLEELQMIYKYIEYHDYDCDKPLLERIRNAYPSQKSPVEEAYKEWMGEYPSTDESVDNTDDIRWRAFQIGWMKAQSKDAGVQGCPDELEYDLKEGTAPPEPTPTVFRQKLFDGIKSVFYDPEYERTYWKHKVNMAVDEVLTHFYDVIPNTKEIVDDFEKGWNSCLTSIDMCMEHTRD